MFNQIYHMQNINKFQVKCLLLVTIAGGFCDRTIERTWLGFFIMNHYKEGDVVGNCVFIKLDEPYVSPNGEKTRKAFFRCKCGNIFSSRITTIKNKRTNSCGCLYKEAMDRGITHGLSRRNPIYKKWKSIKGRCYNPNVCNYKYYGGRGIKMTDEWINNAPAFIEYVRSLPKYGEPGLTLDRINNNGNYEPGNLRWATHKEQMNNTRKQQG